MPTDTTNPAREGYIAGELRVVNDRIDVFRTNDYAVRHWPDSMTINGLSGWLLTALRPYPPRTGGWFPTLEAALAAGEDIARANAERELELAHSDDLAAEDYYEAVEQARS